MHIQRGNRVASAAETNYLSACALRLPHSRRLKTCDCNSEVACVWKRAPASFDNAVPSHCEHLTLHLAIIHHPLQLQNAVRERKQYRKGSPAKHWKAGGGQHAHAHNHAHASHSTGQRQKYATREGNPLTSGRISLPTFLTAVSHSPTEGSPKRRYPIRVAALICLQRFMTCHVCTPIHTCSEVSAVELSRCLDSALVQLGQ